MATVKAKLKELQDADVRFISLVDRAATRIPFRVLKRNKESDMVDLTRIFKKDAKPEVTAIIVYDTPDAAYNSVIQDCISAQGFAVDKVSKADGTLVYSQVGTHTEGEETLVRLSDQVVVAVKGFAGAPAKGTFADMIQGQGFYNGVNVALEVLGKDITTKMDEGGDAASVGALVDDFKSYCTALISNLPAAAFKVDSTIAAVVAKADAGGFCTICKKKPCACASKDDIAGNNDLDGSTSDNGAKAKKEENSAVDNPGGAKDPGLIPASTFDNVSNETDEEKKKRLALNPGTSTAVDNPGGAKDVGEIPAAAVIPPSVATLGSITKAELRPLMELLQSIAAKQDSLATEVKDLATKQADAKKVVDAVVAKSETLEGKLSSTVAAPAPVEDTPARGGVAQKSDEDPRQASGFTGSWDTSITRKRDRNRK